VIKATVKGQFSSFLLKVSMPRDSFTRVKARLLDDPQICELIEESKQISAETTKIDLATQLMLAQEAKELKEEEMMLAKFLAAWAKENNSFQEYRQKVITP
jgi:pantoate kinase